VRARPLIIRLFGVFEVTPPGRGTPSRPDRAEPRLHRPAAQCVRQSSTSGWW
jgi:hypothetical protein